MAQAVGFPSGRRSGDKQLSKPGPLAMEELDEASMKAWAVNGAKTHASSTRPAWRLLMVFPSYSVPSVAPNHGLIRARDESLLDSPMYLPRRGF